MIESGVADDAYAGANHQNECRSGNGNVSRKAQNKDHHWHMNNSAANAEDRRQESDNKRKGHT